MPTASDAAPDIAAVILAGGRGRRMGGVAKALLPLAGRPLLDHARRRVAGQVWPIAVSANDAAVAAAAAPLPVLADRYGDRRGPLAGLLAGMEWARAHHPGVTRVLSLPVDCPFLPRDLAARLLARAAETGAAVTVSASGGIDHPTVALWDLALVGALGAVVEAGTDLSVRRFYQPYPVAVCAFDRPGLEPDGRRWNHRRSESADHALDAFFNVNTPADLARAEDALRMGEDLEPVLAGDADQGHADGLGLPHREQSGG
jgi:molybdenum cofactor guanylyltransferase